MCFPPNPNGSSSSAGAPRQVHVADLDTTTGRPATSNWSGPTTVTQGSAPRLAGGKSGLFLLSGDELSASAHAPEAVDIRQYDVASHAFGAPTRLTGISNPSGLDPDSGGLGQSFTTGELAAAWPDVTGSDGILSLFISTDGGTHFSAAQDIATIGSAYADGDDARVALAPNGTGFVTWRDGGGLHVADLDTLGLPYKRLTVHHGFELELPATCESPSSPCTARVRVRAKGTTIASAHVKVPSGRTVILRVHLGPKGKRLLAHAKGHLAATLRLTITHPGASSERVDEPTELVHYGSAR